MPVINSLASLGAAITELESKRDQEKHIMLSHLHETYESFKLINIVKSTLKVTSDLPDLTQKIMTSATGIGVGYIVHIIFAGLKNDLIRKFLHSASVYGISKLVAQNPRFIKSVCNRLSIIIKILQAIMFRKKRSVRTY